MLLEWDQPDLARAALLSTRTVQIFENSERGVGDSVIAAIVGAFVHHGCVFMDGGVCGPGLINRKTKGENP
jgi:hypothetical protein